MAAVGDARKRLAEELSVESGAGATILSLSDLADELAANIHVSWYEAFKRLAAEVHAAAFCTSVTPPVGDA